MLCVLTAPLTSYTLPSLFVHHSYVYMPVTVSLFIVNGQWQIQAFGDGVLHVMVSLVTALCLGALSFG